MSALSNLAAEKLGERHALPVNKETLQQWMIADGLWRRKKSHQRRSCCCQGENIDPP